ncbi:MAG: Crp/Fnr family transcriptional regulator [Rhodospirillales bacterium]|nr:Crp/Fnr family transcriptional regulator [Rhodospirillales bacterium]
MPATATSPSATPEASPTLGEAGHALLLSEHPALIGGPPNLLKSLSPKERALLFDQGTRRVFYRGATVFRQGAANDGLYLIEHGRIRVFYGAPSGREITLAYWHPGNFVGAPEVFGERTHMWSGIAAANSVVVHLRGAVLRGLVARMPALAIGLIEGLAFKGRCYSALAQMLGTRSVTERLARLLLHLLDAYGVADPRGVLVSASFTHADLAHMVGATRQWVTISLKRLGEQGVLETHRGRILILDPQALRAMQEEGDGAG